MFTIALYALSLVFLGYSFIRDREKTAAALKKASASFLNILPDFTVVIALVGIMLALVTPQMVVKTVGAQSGLGGVLLASLLGSVALIPGFVAFPIAATLLRQGAGVTQIATFISTLMMVGFVTFPLETRYFGRRETILRNSLAYVYSLALGLIMGAILS